MEEETDEERYTLTSFEPLSPEHEKPSFFRSIGAFAKKKLTGNAHDRQPEHETSTRVEKAPENGTQLYPKKQNFIEGLPTPRLEDNNHSKWKANDSKFGSRLPPRPKTPISSNRNTRTPSSVLRRLSLLVLVDKTSQQQSKSSNDLKQYWMPDEQCKVCYECGVKFNTFRRRHHCRLCGQIFCSRCCNEELSGQQIGYTGVFRVCVYCKKIVLTYTSSSDVENNLKQLKEDLSLVAQPDCTNSPASGLHGRNTFDVLGVSAEEANLLKQDSLKDLWLQITAPKVGLECHSHRMRLRTYSNCLVGRELVDWLMVHRKAQNRCQAIQVCQGLQDSGWIEPLVGSRELEFKDDFASLYIPGPSATGESSFPGFRATTPLPVHENLTASNNSDDFFIKRRYYKEKCEVGSALSVSYDQRFTEKGRGFHKSHSTSKIRNMEPFVAEPQNRSSSCEEVFLKVDIVENIFSKENQSIRSQSPSAGARAFTSQQATVTVGNADGDYQDVDKVTANDLSLPVTPEESDENAAFQQLGSIHRQHFSSFLVQLLDRVHLSQSWKEIIEPLVVKVSETVTPDVAHDDDMDIRQYVKIKKIPEGEKSACRIVSGVVCTKNVVHKKMVKSITQPLILMLTCPVDFHRVENKLASLDPLVLQEEEFLKNYVGRIVALKPTLVLVEKTVSRLAKDMLLSKGISVILNVKPKLMAKISRCTEGDVLPSLDQGSRPRLGTCQNFKIEKFVFKNGSTKTLAFFEGCNPRLGSTIVLRGANVAELSRVRDILKFMLYVAYNSKLEKAFVMDEFGTPFRQEQIENVKENGETGVENENERSFGNESEGVEEVGSENVASSDEDVKFQISPKKESEQMEKGLKHEETSEKDEQCLKAIAVFNEKTVSIEDNSTEEKNKGNVVNCESFKKVLDSIILCSSPLITYPVPYILTSEGQRCELLAYMPDDLYWSPMFSDSLSDGRCSPDEDCTDSGERPESRNIFVKETHPFVFAVLKKDAGEVQELLAHYRAQGGKITLKNHSNVSYKVKDESVFIPCQNESDGLGKAVDVPDGVADTFHRKNCDNGRRDEQFSVTLPSMKDCFDPFFHQMIAILFSSYCSHSSNFPHPCISPWTVFMEFYAKNDIALGCFLERYCFRSSYVCPNTNCDVPMVQHVRYFAHGNGAVYINMKNLEAPIPGFSTTLLTWSWCKVCKQVTPVVPVSPEAWRLSFAKYLELRMYGTCYGRRSTDAPCSHSLHQDHYQYFAFNNIVASFKYIPVKIFEVHLPPSAITLLEEERQPQFWVKHIQEMSVRVHHLVNLINDRIASLKTESFISNCVTDIGHDKGQLYEKIKVLESKSMLLLNPPSSPDETNDNKLLEPHEILGLEYEILDGLTLLKRMMCQYGEKWNTQLLELHQLENEKKKYKTIDGRSSSSTQVISQSPVDSISSSQMTSDSVFNNWYSSSVPPVESAIDSEIVVIPDNQDTLKTTQEDSQPQDVTNSANLSAQTLVDEEQTSSSSDESETKIDALNGPRGISTSCEKKIQRHSELWATLSREVNSTLKDAQFLEDPPGPKMKRIISRVLPGVNFRPIPSPFPPHQHHLLPTSELIPIVVNEKEPTSIIAYTLSTVDYRKKLHEIQDSMLDMESDGESFTCIDVEADGACRLSTQSPTRNRTRSEAETISSTSLMTKLDDFVDNYFDCSESDDEENGLKNNATKDKDDPSDVKTDEDVKRDEDSVTDGKEQPSTFNSSSQEDVEYHIRHSFSDSSAKFFCVVYFGEQFRRIRKTVFPEGEEKYVRSLQHCLTWRATGGKSGSSFSKTTDDRFVIKGMSRPEAQSFLNIAPYYFQYIDKAINEKRPTLLAKIVGVYRIGCTSKTTNTPIREDLLVMDNLLYNCKVDQVFDLKGSIRSRYVMSEEGNSVLMDENLLEMISDSPLFIRPHSKAVLSRAINQDTEFLARHMVMDYSLLLGIERDSSRLIVGIIDFIRTFTWDKKLEMYVKSTGILGGQGKMPTVVSPELYRERFCEAMQRYFLMIPNKWIGLGNELK